MMDEDDYKRIMRNNLLAQLLAVYGLLIAWCMCKLLGVF